MEVYSYCIFAIMRQDQPNVGLTGSTVTRIVASRATIREIIDKVSMTRYSCLCGFHSGGTALVATMSFET